MAMRNLLIGGMATLAIAALSVVGCKKGPGDPFISLKSRNARLKGTWQLNKVEYVQRLVRKDPNATCTERITAKTITSDDGINFTKYDTITIYNPAEDKCVPEADQTPFTGSFEFTVNKDGSYTFKASAGTSRAEGTGYWTWVNSKKKKVLLSFDFSSAACSFGDMLDEDEATNILSGQWYVYRLASKELVLESSCYGSLTDGDETTQSARVIRLTFAKKK